eukprot:1989809-Amphidinium_carterae.1
MSFVRHGSRASGQERGTHPYGTPPRSPREGTKLEVSDVDMAQILTRGEDALRQYVTRQHRDENISVRRVATFRDEHRTAEVMYERVY